MKKLALAMLVAFSAFGADSKPILTKWSGGGFMMPEYAGNERCDLYADKVVITRQLGMVAPTAIRIVEEKKLGITGDLSQVIEKARAEKVTEKPNGLCDGPSSSISAESEGHESLLLFITGGCGSPRRERTGVYSSKLVQIINQYCPKTYDFGAGR